MCSNCNHSGVRPVCSVLADSNNGDGVPVVLSNGQIRFDLTAETVSDIMAATLAVGRGDLADFFALALDAQRSVDGLI